MMDVTTLFGVQCQMVFLFVGGVEWEVEVTVACEKKVGSLVKCGQIDGRSVT